MNKIETAIEGVFVIEPDVHADQRGLFFETYSRPKFADIGINDDFVQDNHSASMKGVLRGLHFQYPPKAMSKLARCIRGRLFDVVVDMRKDSPTFKKWVGVELSEENHKMLYMPQGCAHGFYALSDCELLYKCGHNVFNKETDAGFRFDDQEIGVVWPLEGEPILSDRDKVQPTFADVVDKVNL